MNKPEDIVVKPEVVKRLVDGLDHCMLIIKAIAPPLDEQSWKEIDQLTDLINILGPKLKKLESAKLSK